MSKLKYDPVQDCYFETEPSCVEQTARKIASAGVRNPYLKRQLAMGTPISNKAAASEGYKDHLPTARATPRVGKEFIGKG